MGADYKNQLIVDFRSPRLHRMNSMTRDVHPDIQLIAELPLVASLRR